MRRLAGWHWFLLSGLVALATAVLMVLKLPYSHSFTPATLGGLSLLVAGLAPAQAQTPAPAAAPSAAPAAKK